SATLPNDDSMIGSDHGMSGVPQVAYRRNVTPDPTTIPLNHSITEFENVPAGYCQSFTAPASGNGGNPCPVADHVLGGYGQFHDSNIDSFQGRVVGTSLFTLAGHHVVKAGAEVQFASYKNVRAWSGLNNFREDDDGTTFFDFGYYGFL